MSQETGLPHQKNRPPVDNFVDKGCENRYPTKRISPHTESHLSTDPQPPTPPPPQGGMENADSPHMQGRGRRERVRLAPME